MQKTSNPTEVKQIIFFGDSLTAGYGLRSASTESFPALLQHKINHAGFDYQITNAGVSGDTTQSALHWLKNILHTRANIFILALGANDMIRNHSPLATATNLEKIILRVKERYPEVKIISCTKTLQKQGLKSLNEIQGLDQKLKSFPHYQVLQLK